MAESRVHVFVSGNVQDVQDVQDVHFPDNTHETVRAHGVNGWVRNLDDGPVQADVEGVEAEIGDPQGDLGGFEKR